MYRDFGVKPVNLTKASGTPGVTLWHHSPSAACRDAVGNFLLPVRPQDAFSVQRILIARISRIHHENLHLCAIASGHHRGGRCVGSKIAVRGSSDSVHSSGGVRIRTRDLVDLHVAIRSNST